MKPTSRRVYKWKYRSLRFFNQVAKIGDVSKVTLGKDIELLLKSELGRTQNV